MPDTGAPWNIPYVASTDLVSDWPTDSQDLADAIADGLDIGLGTNVAQAVKTDAFSTTSTSFTPLTGMSVSITPSSATSKVLVLVSMFVTGTSGGYYVFTKLKRGATDIFIGDASSSRTRVSGMSSGVSTSDLFCHSFVYLDSPATTSSTTYSIDISCPNSAGSQTALVNRTSADSDAATTPRTASSITVIEVAA